MPTTAPYGSWQSPITTDLMVSGSIGLGQVSLDDEDIYWVEMRPAEGGRMVVVKRTPEGEITDVTPETFSVRTRVHEYGGGAYLVQKGVVYFSNFTDQRLYRQDPGREPKPITPETDMRYADGCFDAARNRIICVCEDHTSGGEPVNAIVAVDALGKGEQLVLSKGSDFCSSPRISPDGSTLAWLTWDHPNMPWDGTTLYVADLDTSGPLPTAGTPRVVAGGDQIAHVAGATVLKQTRCRIAPEAGLIRAFGLFGRFGQRHRDTHAVDLAHVVGAEHQIADRGVVGFLKITTGRQKKRRSCKQAAEPSRKTKGCHCTTSTTPAAIAMVDRALLLERLTTRSS